MALKSNKNIILILILAVFAVLDALFTFRAAFDSSKSMLISVVLVMVINLYIILYYALLDSVNSINEKDTTAETILQVLLVFMMFGDTISSFYGTYVGLYSNRSGDLNSLVDIGFFQFLISSMVSVGVSGATFLLGRLYFKSSSNKSN